MSVSRLLNNNNNKPLFTLFPGCYLFCKWRKISTSTLKLSACVINLGSKEGFSQGNAAED